MSTRRPSSAASELYKRQTVAGAVWFVTPQTPLSRAVWGDFAVPAHLEEVQENGPVVSRGGLVGEGNFNAHDESWLMHVVGGKRWTLLPPSSSGIPPWYLQRPRSRGPCAYLADRDRALPDAQDPR